MTARLTHHDYMAFAECVEVIEGAAARLKNHRVLTTKRNFDFAERLRDMTGVLQSLEMEAYNRGVEIEREVKARAKKIAANKKAKAAVLAHYDASKSA